MTPQPYLNVLVKKGEDDNALVALNAVTDILYFKHIKGNYTHVIASDGVTYYTTTSVFEIELNLSNYDFRYLHRDVVVNMKLIKNFDDDYGVVYFSEEIDKSKPNVSVTRAAYKVIEKYYDYKTANAKQKRKSVWSYITDQ